MALQWGYSSILEQRKPQYTKGSAITKNEPLRQIFEWLHFRCNAMRHLRCIRYCIDVYLDSQCWLILLRLQWLLCLPRVVPWRLRTLGCRRPNARIQGRWKWLLYIKKLENFGSRDETTLATEQRLTSSCISVTRRPKPVQSLLDLNSRNFVWEALTISQENLGISRTVRLHNEFFVAYGRFNIRDLRYWSNAAISNGTTEWRKSYSRKKYWVHDASAPLSRQWQPPAFAVRGRMDPRWILKVALVKRMPN